MRPLWPTSTSSPIRPLERRTTLKCPGRPIDAHDRLQEAAGVAGSNDLALAKALISWLGSGEAEVIYVTEDRKWRPRRMRHQRVNPLQKKALPDRRRAEDHQFMDRDTDGLRRRQRYAELHSQFVGTEQDSAPC